MADLGWFVFSSSGVVLCLVVGTLWALATRGATGSRRFLVGVTLFYCVSSAYIVPSTLKRLMITGYAPLTAGDVPAGRTAVVLLGSGSYRFRDWSGNEFATVDPIGSSRLLEAARVFRLVQADYIISSGGLTVVRERNRPSGSTMAEALERLGVPHARLRVEDESKTTRDEALIVSRMLAAQPVDNVILVTSQFHMRRSVGAFRAAGVDVIPAIAREPQGLERWWENLFPTDKAMDETGMAAHELAGLVTYAVRGWYR